MAKITITIEDVEGDTEHAHVRMTKNSPGELNPKGSAAEQIAYDLALLLNAALESEKRDLRGESN